MGLRITSWNVNGIRNPFGYQPWRENRTFQAMFDTLEADIVVMQETKIQRKDLQDDMVLVPGWDVYFSLPKHKKGYSGVAIYTRNSKCAPIRAEEGVTGILCPPNSTTSFRDLPEDQQIGGYPTASQLSGTVDEETLDSEGRAVILEFPAFVLVGTYSPATRDETRHDFRMGYLEALEARIRNLVAMGKRVVLTGDLNIIRAGIDTANIAERLKKEGMTMEEFFSSSARRMFNQLVYEGVVHGARDEGREQPVLWDLGRLFHPIRQGMFTCWETKKNARPGNFGSRIDYVLCSENMREWFIDANIQEGLLGSDHCPVYANMSDVVKIDGQETELLDIMNPPGMFKDGKRLREWTTKDLLPMSAKLIPEFDRRQSIKQMFMRKPTETPKLMTPFIESTQTSRTDEILDIEASQSSEQYLTPSQATASTSASSPSRSTLKRTPSVSTIARPQKKTKANLAKEPSSKGQSSLMGFFKPKNNPSPGPKVEDTGSNETINEINTSAAIETPKAKSEPAELVLDTDSDRVFDPIVAKESWSKLLGKRVVPRCEHGEPCISLQTKKPGVNCGRSFYICARPLGPSGDKERGTQWRCSTFIWSSDWNSSQAG